MKAISFFITFTLYYAVVTTSIQQSLEEDKIFIIIGKDTFLVRLIENQITKELISVLPLKTYLLEEKQSSKHLPLTIKIETENYDSIKLPSIEVYKGDLYLYKEKELVLFNETTTINNNNGEYVKLGFIEQVDVLFDVMKKYKNIKENDYLGGFILNLEDDEKLLTINIKIYYNLILYVHAVVNGKKKKKKK